MTTDANPEEKPKAEVAKEVVTPKRRYFSPSGHSVEAESLPEAVKLIKKKQKQEEDKDKEGDE